MRYVTTIVFLQQFLLGRRLSPIEVDDDELRTMLILLVQIYGAASLPLGVESALAKDENVVRLAANAAVFKVVAGDKRAVAAVARIIQLRVKAQVLRRGECDRYT